MDELNCQIGEGLLALSLEKLNIRVEKLTTNQAQMELEIQKQDARVEKLDARVEKLSRLCERCEKGCQQAVETGRAKSEGVKQLQATMSRKIDTQLTNHLNHIQDEVYTVKMSKGLEERFKKQEFGTLASVDSTIELMRDELQQEVTSMHTLVKVMREELQQGKLALETKADMKDVNNRVVYGFKLLTMRTNNNLLRQQTEVNKKMKQTDRRSCARAAALEKSCHQHTAEESMRVSMEAAALCHQHTAEESKRASMESAAFVETAMTEFGKAACKEIDLRKIQDRLDADNAVDDKLAHFKSSIEDDIHEIARDIALQELKASMLNLLELFDGRYQGLASCYHSSC